MTTPLARPLALLLSSSLALSLIVIPNVRAFSDVAGTHPYQEAITSLKSSNVIEGYSDGTFKPDSTINRAEFVKIIIESVLEDGADISDLGNCFPDVKTEWFAPYICYAAKQGIINGYPDGTFKPEQLINFAETSKIISLAYKQDPETYNQWYKGFIEALDNSRAIPSSIDSLESNITRSEMVEMMWRITEGVTDRPSKSYYNIKYPEVAIDLSSDGVQYAKSCNDLAAFTKELNEESSNNKVYMMEDAIAMPMMRTQAVSESIAAPTAGAVAADGAADFSETNVQVEGVDEADIVKTDGTFIYNLVNNTLIITKAVPVDGMKILSETSLNDSNNDDNFYAQDLYIQDGKVIVLGSFNERIDSPRAGLESSKLSALSIAPDYYPGYYSKQYTQARLFSFSESAGLNLERTVSIEGNKVSSRVIGDTLYLIANKGFYWHYPMPLLEQADQTLIPQFRDSARGGDAAKAVDCTDIAILPRVPHPQYLSIASIPLDSMTAEVNREVIVGHGENVYMSLENLYIANTQWNYHWRRGSSNEQKTNLYRFKIVGDGLEYKANGSVPGRILNQFSMDEYNDNFRIATTVDQDWQNDTPSYSNVFSLNLDLERIGGVTNIAPGETTYSSRFMGDRTYLVTFKKVDPFFVIDTSNPRDYKILGQLKIPGYSDYLHPYDRHHIIGIGKDAVAAKDFDFAYQQGLKVALFDVRDVTNPTLKANFSVGDRGTDSEVLRNHKALLFDKDRDLLAFPITINTLNDEQRKNNEDGSAWGEQTFQGAIVLNITPEGITERGRMTHYTEEDKKKLGSYFYGKNIERILRIGEVFYSVGRTGIKAHDEATTETINEGVDFEVGEGVVRFY